MDIIDALLGEHAVLYAMFDHIEQSRGSRGVGEVNLMARSLVSTLVPHAQMEEALVFKPLDAQMGPGGPVTVMRSEHEEIEGLIHSAVADAQPDSAMGKLLKATALARNHFAKEEQILFPLARQTLSVTVLQQGLRQWADTRKVMVM